MKLRSLIILFSIVGLLISCSNDSTNEPEGNQTYDTEMETLFNVSSGNSYTYSVDTLNLSNNTFDNIGSRVWEIGSKVDDSEYGYFDCSESYKNHEIVKISKSKFRLTDNCIDFYTDSTGLSSLIPDSIEVEIILDLDEYAKLVEFPYSDNHKWNAYNGAANFSTFKFNMFRVYGEYAGSQDLQLDGFSEIIETEKFDYDVVLNIPNIINPFLDYTQNYEASIWISPKYGIVKIEGCDLFIKPILGGQFDDADSNKVSRHILTGVN